MTIIYINSILSTARKEGYMEKPTCEIFILAAIRAIRKNPKTSQRPPSGVALERIFAIVREKYQEKEIGRALEALVRNQTILVTAWSTTATSERQPRKMAISKFPHSPCGAWSKWYLDDEGRVRGTKEEAGEDWASVYNLFIYIVADGLPRAAMLPAPNTSARTADKIMEQLTNSVPKP